MHSTEKEDRGHWGPTTKKEEARGGGDSRFIGFGVDFECHKCQAPPMTPTAVGRFLKSAWFLTWLALHTKVARYVRHLYTKKR